MSEQVEEQMTFPRAIRLLRCRKTRRYYSGEGWTMEAEQAEKYRDELQAARACVTKDLHDVDLVVCSQGSGIELFSTAVR